MFLHSLSEEEIAVQVAALLNTYNGLRGKKSANHVQHSQTQYIIESHGRLVLGAVGIDRVSYTMTEVKHLVVLPEWRKRGVGLFLVKRALSLCNTPHVYATVRESNKGSIGLFQKAGFWEAGKYFSQNHNVLLLVRVSPQWEQMHPSWKFGSLGKLSSPSPTRSSMLTSYPAAQTPMVDTSE